MRGLQKLRVQTGGLEKCSLYFIKIIESNGLPVGVKKVKNLVHVIFEHSHGVELGNQKYFGYF